MTTKLGSVTQPSVSPLTRTATPASATQVAATQVAKPQVVTNDVPVTAPVPGFTQGGVEEKAVLNPKGSHVAKTAAPDALWGAAEPKETDPLKQAMTEFKSMSPEKQQAKIAELKTQQDQLSKRMLGRIDALEARYVQMRNVHKGEMLRTLMGESNALTPDQRTHLDTLLSKAEGISKEIVGLQAKAQLLPSRKEATPAQLAERTELARLIKNARSRLSDATQASTKYVDSLGLKTDRLAVNEQRIDPNAPPKGSPDSLSSMMNRWFEFETVIGKLEKVFATVTQVVKNFQQDVEKQGERIREDSKRAAERDQVDRRRQADDQQKARNLEARNSAERELSALLRRSGTNTVAAEPDRAALNIALARLGSV